MRYLVIAVMLAACSQTAAPSDSGQAGDGGSMPCTECMPRCTGPGDAPVDCVNPMTGIVCSACAPTCMGGPGRRAACGGPGNVVCYCPDGFPCEDGDTPSCWTR